MVALAEEDLAGARAVLRAGLAAVEPAVLLALLGNYLDLYWVLDDAQQQQFLTLPPAAFDGDRGNWALVRGETHALRGNQALARAYADSARLAYEAQLRAAPDDASGTSFGGWCWPTQVARPSDPGRKARRRAMAHQSGRIPGRLYPAPARAHLPAGW
jgi:hypothetical protein